MVKGKTKKLKGGFVPIGPLTAIYKFLVGAWGKRQINDFSRLNEEKKELEREEMRRIPPLKPEELNPAMMRLALRSDAVVKNLVKQYGAEAVEKMKKKAGLTGGMSLKKWQERKYKWDSLGDFMGRARGGKIFDREQAEEFERFKEEHPFPSGRFTQKKWSDYFNEFQQWRKKKPEPPDYLLPFSLQNPLRTKRGIEDLPQEGGRSFIGTLTGKEKIQNDPLYKSLYELGKKAKTYQDKIKQAKGGKFDARRDILDGLAGPIGWILMAIRKRKERENEKLRQKLNGGRKPAMRTSSKDVSDIPYVLFNDRMRMYA